jgi:hypothetical protein
MYYKNDTSYQDHPFRMVINYLDDNDIIFEDINFSMVHLALDGVEADKNRGNYQTNYGYATLNNTDIDKESSFRRPNLVNNTIMQSDNFIALSQRGGSKIQMLVVFSIYSHVTLWLLREIKCCFDFLANFI